MHKSKVVITTMKNEAPYILEWVAHHLAIGFDHIVAFTNDCADTTNDILTHLQTLGHVTLLPNHRGAGGVHRTALRQARRMDIVKNADWLYVTDADEFLNIHVGDHSVDALIAASGGDDVDIIMIPWRIFSCNNRTILRDSPVTAQFIDAELTYENGGAGRRFVKSLFRNKDVYRRIGLHNPHPRKEYATELKWALPGAVQTSTTPWGNHVQPPFGHDFAQINHYAVRSAQGYLLKKFRGRANHQSHVLESGYWDRWNRGGETDTSIHRYAPKMNALLDAFKADPALLTAHRRGFKWHKRTLTQLLEDPEYSALHDKIAASEPAREVKKDRAIRPSVAPAKAKATDAPAPLPPVGTLWVEGPLSFVEQLSLLSFVAVGHPVQLYHYGRVDNVPEGIEVIDAREIHDTKKIIYNKQFKTPVVQSDIFRLHMIKKTDNIWVDSDMLCLQPFLPKDGYLFGFFRRNELCNAVMRLPKDSPALNAYLDYTQDEYPISPKITGQERAALRASGTVKHASEQAHSVYGPGVFTWFTRDSGEISYAAPTSVFYPVPFRQCGEIADNHTKQTRDTYFSDDTCGVHMWGRRFRWWVAGRGISRYSLLDRQLRRLGLDPGLAPIPTVRSPYPETASFPIDLPAQKVSNADIAKATDAAPEAITELASFIRMAERILPLLKARGSYGIAQPADPEKPREIDNFRDDPAMIYLLAQKMEQYRNAHQGLLRFDAPTSYSEKCVIEDMFAPESSAPTSPPAGNWRFIMLAGQVGLIEAVGDDGKITLLDHEFQPIAADEDAPHRRRPRNYAKMVACAQEAAAGTESLTVGIQNDNGAITMSGTQPRPRIAGLTRKQDQALGALWVGTAMFPIPKTSL